LPRRCCTKQRKHWKSELADGEMTCFFVGQYVYTRSIPRLYFIHVFSRYLSVHVLWVAGVDLDVGVLVVHDAAVEGRVLTLQHTGGTQRGIETHHDSKQ
jgi:hypothetical protein